MIHSCDRKGRKNTNKWWETSKLAAPVYGRRGKGTTGIKAYYIFVIASKVFLYRFN